jgi:hypothetical protein
MRPVTTTYRFANDTSAIDEVHGPRDVLNRCGA